MECILKENQKILSGLTILDIQTRNMHSNIIFSRIHEHSLHFWWSFVVYPQKNHSPDQMKQPSFFFRAFRRRFRPKWLTVIHVVIIHRVKILCYK